MNIKDISRRNFLKKIGAGSAVVAASGFTGCVTAEETEEISGVMEHRVNPSTGDEVSLLGYGCMRFPTLEKPEEDGNIVDQKTVDRLVDYAIEHGVNYFDTAPVYLRGWSEVAMGKSLSRHPRSSYFIATKLSMMQDPTFDNSVKMYHDSMEKLKVDYIDYYLLHTVGGGKDPFALLNARFFDNGMLDYLLKEREEGRIRNLGFSFHGDVRIFDYLLGMHDRIHWDFVQIQMNYSDWNFPGVRNVKAEYLYGRLESLGIPAIVMEPLLGGRLAKFPPNISDRLLQRDPERSLASWAFRFAGTKKGVLTVLSGMSCMEHLEENVETFTGFTPLSDEDFEFLLETAVLLRKYPLLTCNDCKYCMPCPYGLDIPAVLLYYNKCVNNGYMAYSSQNAGYAKARRAFLAGYDRAIPKERQAEHCIGCRECMDKCPQSKTLDIPEAMQRIDRYVASLRRGVVVLAELKEILHKENCSLVISLAGIDTEHFSGRGVSDLYRLYTSGDGKLSGACVADKVVGKGAAMLMALGGVREVYADMISEPGLKCLKDNGIRVQYGKKTEEILNRAGDGLCPVEKICKEHDNAEECIPLIGEFLKSQGLL